MRLFSWFCRPARPHGPGLNKNSLLFAVSDIPILPTVSAKITFQEFEFKSDLPESLFQVPAHYHEDQYRFPDLWRNCAPLDMPRRCPVVAPCSGHSRSHLWLSHTRGDQFLVLDRVLPLLQLAKLIGIAMMNLLIFSASVLILELWVLSFSLKLWTAFHCPKLLVCVARILTCNEFCSTSYQ